jgi:hypothetical protein
MARNKKLQTNIDLSNPTDYPDGRIKNNTGAGDGTPVNEQVYGDIHEFFAKLMRSAGFSYNGQPENETAGYQYVNALKQFANKNNYISTLQTASGGKLRVSIDLPQMKIGEFFLCLSNVNVGAQAILTTLGSGVDFAINFKGGVIKSGDYVRGVVTNSGVDLIRLADGNTAALIISELGYLLAASQVEEDAGAINTKATTPLTNKTVFTKRVTGADSGDFLATNARNGLMSQAHVIALEAVSNPERNYGTFGTFDVNTGSVNDLYGVSGDVTEAKLIQRHSNGQIIQVTLDNAMNNLNYEVKVSVESLGNIELDNNIEVPTWKKISTTVFQVIFAETVPGVQNIKAHIAVIQR